MAKRPPKSGLKGGLKGSPNSELAEAFGTPIVAQLHEALPAPPDIPLAAVAPPEQTLDTGGIVTINLPVAEAQVQSNVYGILWDRANSVALLVLILLPFAILVRALTSDADIAVRLGMFGGSIMALFFIGNTLRWTIAVLLYTASTASERVRTVSIVALGMLLCVSTGIVWQCLVLVCILWFLKTKLMGDSTKVEAEITIKNE